ncbi:hypothetical protein CGRA01v4_01830 [Colletotrichum graminicola]|nr:hypothetical protein CGRA01v4_01830 [Colletotrichum graminicola]
MACRAAALIPDASRPVMSHRLCTSGLQLLHGIIQKEINQDGVDARSGVLLLDLPLDELDAPDTARWPIVSTPSTMSRFVGLTSHLQLQPRSTFNDSLVDDGRRQRRAIVQAAHSAEDLRNAVVGEHCDLVNVPESTEALTAKARPDVRHEDLCPLENSHGLPSTLKLVLVAETVKVPGEQVDHPGGRAVGGLDELCNAAIVPVVQHGTSFTQASQTLLEQGHLLLRLGAKDMPHEFHVTIILALPEVGAGDGDALVESALQRGNHAPVSGPGLAAILDGVSLVVGLFGPEAEVEQVHGEDESCGGLVLGFGVQLMLGPGRGRVLLLLHLSVDGGGGALSSPHVNGDIDGVIVDELSAIEDTRLRLIIDFELALEVLAQESQEFGVGLVVGHDGRTRKGCTRNVSGGICTNAAFPLAGCTTSMVLASGVAILFLRGGDDGSAGLDVEPGGS